MKTNNKMIAEFSRRCVAACAFFLALAASAGAQTVVTGTGDPDVDVPAVQAAVDQGGEVILKGHFSFDRAPTIPIPLLGYPQAMILVSQAVAISGEPGEDWEMTTIEAGTIPFFVNAPAARVTNPWIALCPPEGGGRTRVCG